MIPVIWWFVHRKIRKELRRRGFKVTKRLVKWVVRFMKNLRKQYPGITWRAAFVNAIEDIRQNQKNNG